MKKILTRAANILAKGWTQGYYAKSESGHCIESNDSRAVRFCAVGALQRASLELGVGQDAVDDIAKELRNFGRVNNGVGGLVSWNDAKGRKKSEVIRLFRDAARVID